jgi:betaine-aldehyde dehydrogenase
VTLELGGKSPQIVLADADLNAALPGVAMASLPTRARSAPPERVLVARELYDDVVGGLADAARGVRLGDPFDERTTMGALINSKQRDRVTGYIERGTAEGAEPSPAVGVPTGRASSSSQPCSQARNAIGIAQENPRARRARPAVRRPEQAIGIANDTRYGLAAYLWTQNLSRRTASQGNYAQAGSGSAPAP